MGKDDYIGTFLYPASKDIEAIHDLLPRFANHCEVITFHAQQAAEKIIKSVFEANGRSAPKTHALDEILDLAVVNGWLSATPKEVRAAADLSKYAVLVRYITAPDVGKGEALQAIADCNSLSEMVERAGYPAIKIKSPAEFLHDSPSPQTSLEREGEDGRAASAAAQGRKGPAHEHMR